MTDSLKEYLLELLDEHILDMECDITHATLDSDEIAKLQSDVEYAEHCRSQLSKIKTII